MTQAPDSDEMLSDLTRQIALYKGELLPGFYEDWVLLERERVEQVFERKMQQLVELLVRQERWTAVLEWAERWIALGHTPEPAYRALMLAHGALGNPGQLTVNYERCVHALRNELGVEPSQETRILYEHLLKGAQLYLVPVQPAAKVTFLFTNIEGSTRHLERLGEQYALVLHEHHEILRAVVRKCKGQEFYTQDDAFFATFARATDAVECAVQAQRDLAAHPWMGGERVRVRMGLYTGELLMATTEHVGIDVHRASRISDAGHGGQILLSQTTRDLVAHELPSGVSLRDLGEHRLKDSKFPTEIYQLVIEDLQTEFPPLRVGFNAIEPPSPGEPPFKGLDFFDEADAALFFGREEVTAKLTSALREKRFLAVVVGASGSGKSSIVRAGLIPALRQTTDKAWQIYVMTPPAHPLEALAVALTRESESVTATATLLDDLSRDPRSLQLFLRRHTTDDKAPTTRTSSSQAQQTVPHTLLVVDQFEELFTLCRADFEREQFIDNLVDAVQVPTGEGAARTRLLTLVITLRADFYAHLAQYPDLRAAVAAQQEYIGPMNVEELRRAIEEPARQGGWEFEPGLVDLILRDVGDEPGALPLLSHALMETWKRRSGHTLTLKGYHEAGGVRGAIAQTAEATYQHLSPEDQAMARNIFLRLTELGAGTEDTRRRATIQELTPNLHEAEHVRAVLNIMADARLITLAALGVGGPLGLVSDAMSDAPALTQQETAEVAHEALIREWSRLREWLNQDREGLQLHRHLTEAANEWEMMERDASILYRGARLAQAREWAAQIPNALNTQELGFLDASLHNAEREKREREEQRERELLAAQNLAAAQTARAEVETKRAQEQARANKQLRRRALFLAGAFLLAIVLAGIALLLGDRANQNATAAAQNAQAAETARDDSETQQRVANARALAAYSVNSLSVDPQLSILLALQAVQATAPDQMALPEAEEALHRGIIASHAQGVLQADSSLQDVATAGVHRTHHVAYSPDGSQIATRAPGAFKIWDAKTNQQLLNLPVDSNFGAIGLAYRSDGTQIATLDHDVSDSETLVKVFDTHAGTLLRATRISQKWDDVFGAGFSPDLNRVVLLVFGDTPIQIWDTTTGQSIHTLSIGPAENLFPSVAFSVDGKRFAIALENDSSAKIFDTATGKQLMTLCCHASKVAQVTFSPDGKHIATGGWDGKVKIWDGETGKELNTLAGHSNVVMDVAWSPEGKRLASGSWDRKAMMWDVRLGRLIYEFAGHTDFVEDVDFSPDGKMLVTASEDGTARVWDVGPSRELVALEGPPQLFPAGYNTNRTHFYTYDAQGDLKLWDVNSLKAQLAPHVGQSFGGLELVAISPDEKFAAFTEDLHTITLLDLDNGRQFSLIALSKDDFVWAPTFSPDGNRVAAALDNDKGTNAIIWDTKTGETLATFLLGNLLSAYVETVRWSPDGKRFVTGNADGTVQAWDASTGVHLFDLRGHSNYISEIVYSPDASRIATTSRDGTAIVYQADDGKELYRLNGHTSTVDSLDFSPDGKLIVTAAADGTAKVWDAAGGAEILTFNQGLYPVEGAIFTADGRHILTTSDDGALREYTLDVKELVGLAKSRLIRTWRLDECQKFLHVAQCPEQK